ncbi:MAG: toll/interleukin-1 receptor domain-containing protein, partial [Anaerolineae bacterium]|nr:toll/interleukin-1 receptor domain-containing protein [Anaerolineae bacterium]
MPDVFISYSRKDKVFVQQLQQALEAAKRDVWIDWQDIPPTADWWNEIRAGIDSANSFAFVISPQSAASDICHKEVSHAVDSGKRIIPLLYQEVADAELQKKLHPTISTHNWLIFTPDDFDGAFTQLLKALDTDLDYVREHTRLLTRAREWDRHGRTGSYLLDGEEIQAAEHWLAQSGKNSPQSTNLHQDYIFASRQKQQSRQRRLLIGVSVALVVSLGLALLSFLLFQDAQSQRNLAWDLATEAALGQQLAETSERVAENARATAEFNESIAQQALSTSDALRVTAEFFIPRIVVEEEDPRPLNVRSGPGTDY